MQLTKLEIKGFKSFGDKVVINFDQGITGIVGPNGCGKSNVVDAIRWVLGEQKTKALRSEKMENVIFNGTKNRKPMQMAEVALTFNNTKNLLPTEYSQVTVARRYYRSGESEYLLNGITCRLKDITDLFLDTGIGSDSYAILELNMVNDILTDKDNSRRNLFEEAAGISKFKIRKKQSLRKLDETDKDLNRVEDLLFEINKNMKSLERQAKQTEKYYKIKEEYKEASIELAKSSIKGKKDTYVALTNQLEEATDLKTQINAGLAENEAQVEKLRTEQIDSEKTLQSRQKSLNEHTNHIRNYESDKKIKNERLKFLSDRNSALLKQIDEDKESNERAQFSIASLDKEKISALEALDETKVSLDNFKGDYDSQKQKTVAIQDDVNIINTQLKSKQEEVYQFNKQLDIFKVQINSLKQELEKASSDSGTHQTSLVQFEEKLVQINQELEDKKNELEGLEEQEAINNESIAQLEIDIESVKEKITILNRKVDQRQNEYNLTKSMVDNLEGFPEAIKFLKKNTNWSKKEFPLLSDLITCDEKYRIAIENFLEPYMNYYVVENEAEAIHAVNLLNGASKGKANFFVISKFVNTQKVAPKTFNECVPALDIVEFDSVYSGLVYYLFNDVYIIDSMSENLPADSNAIFITISGKITKRKFSITGGSVGLFEGKKIGRAKNLEKLETELKDLTLDLEGAKGVLDVKVNELSRLKESSFKIKIGNVNKHIELLERDHVAYQTKKEQFESMISSNSLRKDEILDRINAIQDELDLTVPKLDSAKDELINLENKLDFINEELVKENEILNQKSAIFNQQNIIFHQQESRLKSIDQEITYKQNSFEASKDRIDKNIEESKNIEEEIKNLMESADVHEDELLDLYKEKDNIEVGVQEAEKAFYAIRSKITEVENALRELRRKREDCDGNLISIQQKINDNKLALSSIKERLNVEFNIKIDELLNNNDEDDDNNNDVILSEAELLEKVEKIKNSLDKIGPINPMAMEAYTEIQERHVFISTQKDDLVKAKESLLATINEIDEVARTTFMDTFNKIKDNFVLVFRSLFTEEDSCSLELSNPDSPLDSSIDIIARPKGKRPLTINQLSGGEKTLTAISLLFAIYLIKPAPFCIFDEVDAPLDDANIDKFNNIIKKFSSESQFIIVTHNKRTMVSTDVIYGITMIEQGVSRLVPVDLRSLQD